MLVGAGTTIWGAPALHTLFWGRRQGRRHYRVRGHRHYILYSGGAGKSVSTPRKGAPAQHPLFGGRRHYRVRGRRRTSSIWGAPALPRKGAPAYISIWGAPALPRKGAPRGVHLYLGGAGVHLYLGGRRRFCALTILH
jgi:hypothetical protein